ncbi:unnamed protein product [Nippostrongylus brasiliensis]|uniref:Remorin_C domain-containing protein n=1 Tax=Nippostrongylus brasiliensis TaxID=27835 RepID=A0A0N4YLH5_NIPBR|nr:unnamed protein product [Nippostrongylus brasiliensis]
MVVPCDSKQVVLQFPKRCTPENISLFSGFMATIPHLIAPLAKDRYKINVEPKCPRKPAHPPQQSVSPPEKIPKFVIPRLSHRRRLTAEMRHERKVRYANAISAWDRAKQKQAQRICFRTSYEGSISSILGGNQMASTRHSPVKWSERSVKVPKESNASSLFDDWATFRTEALPTPNALRWMTGSEVNPVVPSFDQIRKRELGWL